MPALQTRPAHGGDAIAKLQESLRVHGRELDDISFRLSQALEVCGAVQDHLSDLKPSAAQERGAALAFAGMTLLDLVQRDMNALTERLLHASQS